MAAELRADPAPVADPVAADGAFGGLDLGILTPFIVSILLFASGCMLPGVVFIVAIIRDVVVEYRRRRRCMARCKG